MNEEQKTKIIIYSTPEEDVKVDVFFYNETLWLTQEQVAKLFGKGRSTITEHISNIFNDKELDPTQVCREFRLSHSFGRESIVKYYNLDAIIAVGYRVNSKQATQFRIWATKTLKEYMLKGFVLDDNRLKQGKNWGKDYFKELLERVRSIRASERRIYQQITDIFAECSIDYDPKAKTTREFFAMVQNKFHYAITGRTAAEIIYNSADKNKPHMGLETWKHSPKGRVLRSDVIIAKNYLPENQIKRLERNISGFFDYIENLIENEKTFTMTDFANSVDKFLSFNNYKILENKGTISKDQADRKALEQYSEFNKKQIIESDFDKEIKSFLSEVSSK